MELIHPIIALVAIILAVCAAFVMGVRKKLKISFNRSLHMGFGSMANLLFIMSAIGGLFMAKKLDITMNTPHIIGGFLIVVLAIISALSGLFLSKPLSKHRTLIKKMHLISNIFLIMACINLISTGYKVFL